MRLISWNVNGRYGPVLARQIDALLGRRPDVVALQEVREESVDAWREGLRVGELNRTLDSSELLAVPAASGREYKRRYFNLVAARWPLARLPDLNLEFPERYLAATVARDRGAFELHNVHLPPGSTRGLVKVEMFEALFERLARVSERERVICGDLNTPRAEHEDATVEFWGDNHPPDTERWNRAEASVVLGLAEYDLADVFRALYGYGRAELSWVARRGERRWVRRYDHVFASAALVPTSCRYEHAWREDGLSDHSAIEADFCG